MNRRNNINNNINNIRNNFRNNRRVYGNNRGARRIYRTNANRNNNNNTNNNLVRLTNNLTNLMRRLNINRRNNIRNRIRNNEISTFSKGNNIRRDNKSASVPWHNTNTSNNPKKKETRKDKLTSAMQMCLNSSIRSLLPSMSKIVRIGLYNKYSFTPDAAGHSYGCFFFPYLAPYDLYQAYIDGYLNEMLLLSPDAENVMNAASLVYCDINYPADDDSITLKPQRSNNLGIYGTKRLISASMKITNTTPAIHRGGTYTVYRVVQNEIYPFMYGKVNEFIGRNIFTDPYMQFLYGQYDQIQVKRTFNSSEIGLVNEYNIIKGNDTFDGIGEYLGTQWKSENTDNYAKITDQNPIGENIKYYVSFSVPNSQTYFIETWQCFEIIPDPKTNLGMLAKSGTYTVDKNVLESIYTTPNITRFGFV